MTAEVLCYLRHLLPTGEARLADGELLRRFAGGEQATFTELLLRYGPLVWGVCRRVLGDAHAAEDAFQATFLRLAQQAGTLSSDGSLAGWLHTVATRIARRAWLAEQRRRRRERTYIPSPSASAADELTWSELRQLLDAEIARLPEPYRQPLILCYLENQPQREVARRLGLAPGVLRGRLERGRQQLRRRLEKLGLPLAASLLLTQTERVPAALAETTRQLVGTATVGGSVPGAVASLAGSRTLLSRGKLAFIAAMLLVVGGVGIGGATRRTGPGSAPPPQVRPAQGRDAVDALGDPLPPGALRRLGTRRHRVGSGSVTRRLLWHDLPDGKSYLTYHQVGSTSTIHRLDAATGRTLETWRVPALHHVVGFSPEGRYALMVTRYAYSSALGGLRRKKDEQDWVLTLYDLVKRKSLWVNSEKLDGPDWKSVNSACFSADGKWIATAGSALRLWDAATGKEVWHIKSSVRNLEPLGFTHGGNTLVLRGDGNTISLADRATGKQRRSFATMPRGSMECGLAPDGSAVLFSMYGPVVRVWDLATGKERPALGGHKQWTRWFPFSPDRKIVVTGGNDPYVLVRDWPSGKLIRTIDLGKGGIQRMTISGDPPRLEVLFWGEQALHFYDLSTGKERESPPEGHKSDVYGVALAPDGHLLSYSKDGTICTWDLKTGKVVGRLPVEQDLNDSGFAVSPDGRLLAVTPNSAINIIRVYERATGKLIRQLTAEKTLGKQLVFSPEGRWLARADRFAGGFQVWDVSTGRTVLKGKHRVQYGITCAFSPDGRQFAASDEGLVRFWDVRTWKEQPGWKANAPLALAYSPDSRTLAAASVESIRLYEVATGRERAHVRSRGYPEGNLQFSSTGRWLAWTSSPVAQRRDERLRWPPSGTIGTIFVWDVHRGEMLGSFTGHDDTITGLVFTGDDRALVSASADSTMLVWDIAQAATKKPALKAGNVETAWRTLIGDDARAAYEAIRTLASSPDGAVQLLARHLKPAVPIEVKRIDACLRDLDSDEFEVRQRATRTLEQMGEQVVAALERCLAGRPSLEVRKRVERIVEKALAPNPQRLRQSRALEALERMGCDGARRLFEALAKGDPDARLTGDARAALMRIGQAARRAKQATGPPAMPDPNVP
jgi:RNA polymerase sigma factor (sigma-70 family)